MATRFGDWKLVFCEQRKPGGFEVWSEPFVCLRVPKLYNLRMDPYESADVVSNQYNKWLVDNGHLIAFGTLRAAQFLQSFVEWPPSQRPASFSIDQVQQDVDAERLKQQAQAAGKP